MLPDIIRNDPALKTLHQNPLPLIEKLDYYKGLEIEGQQLTESILQTAKDYFDWDVRSSDWSKQKEVVRKELAEPIRKQQALEEEVRQLGYGSETDPVSRKAFEYAPHHLVSSAERVDGLQPSVTPISKC